MNNCFFALLVDRMPVFDPSWPEDTQKNWLKMFDAIFSKIDEFASMQAKEKAK